MAKFSPWPAGEVPGGSPESQQLSCRGNGNAVDSGRRRLLAGRHRLVRWRSGSDCSLRRALPTPSHARARSSRSARSKWRALLRRLRRTLGPALAPLVGTSLVTFSSGEVDRRLARLPEVASATYDRDFPHTLRVIVRAERPAAILRQRGDAWLVSGSGRVLGVVHQPITSELPRVWLAPTDEIMVGAPADRSIAPAVFVAASIRDRHFPRRVTTIRADAGRVSFRLGSGLEIRLGSTTNVAVKLAVARTIVPKAEGALYVDVSVPIRPVAGFPGATGPDTAVPG